MEGFYRQKRVKKGKISNKEWIVSGKVTSTWVRAGVYWAYYFTDQIIPDWLVKGHSSGRG